MGIPAGERYELCIAVHAEANAIINASPRDMQGSTMYISGEDQEGRLANCHPCLMCQRMIANAGIERVIYPHKYVIVTLHKKDLQIFALGGV